MLERARAILVWALVAVAVAPGARAVAECPTACNNSGSCPTPGSCAGNMCWCTQAGPCSGGVALPCGGGGPSGPRDPFRPTMSLQFAVTAEFDGADFEDVMAMFQGAAGWTIEIEDGTDFDAITGQWTATSWYLVLGDILEEQHLCQTTDYETYTIRISDDC